LTRKNTFYCRYGVFKVRAAGFTTQHAHEKTRPERTVSQNSTACTPRSTFVLGEPGDRTASWAIDGRAPPGVQELRYP